MIINLKDTNSREFNQLSNSIIAELQDRGFLGYLQISNGVASKKFRIQSGRDINFKPEGIIKSVESGIMSAINDLHDCSRDSDVFLVSVHEDVSDDSKSAEVLPRYVELLALDNTVDKQDSLNSKINNASVHMQKVSSRKVDEGIVYDIRAVADFGRYSDRTRLRKPDTSSQREISEDFW